MLSQSATLLLADQRAQDSVFVFYLIGLMCVALHFDRIFKNYNQTIVIMYYILSYFLCPIKNLFHIQKPKCSYRITVIVQIRHISKPEFYIAFKVYGRIN